MSFDYFAFPFEQIGWCLRNLSLSGTIGNIIAILFYLLIGSIPCGIYVFLRKENKNIKLDYMLLFLSLFLYVMLYFMINPGFLPVSMTGGNKSIIGGTFYSILVGYFFLRMLYRVHTPDLLFLQKSLRIVLYVIMFFFVWCVVAEIFLNLPSIIKEINQINTAAQVDNILDDLWFAYDGPSLWFTYVFVLIKSLITALPNALMVYIVFLGIKTLDVLLKDGYCETASVLLKKVEGVCKKFLVILIITSMSFNFLQIFFLSQLYKVDIVINIPIFTVLFLLIVHIMAKYIEENQRLKEDNELFI